MRRTMQITAFWPPNSRYQSCHRMSVILPIDHIAVMDMSTYINVRSKTIY